MLTIRRLFNKDNFPLLFFHLVILLIIVANYPGSKYFIGWDALNPEFNFLLNFKRVFSAFWQENQGLGLLGGHGFAAVLPHNIITFILSVLPQNLIRPAFTLICFYLGGLGIYLLISLMTSLLFVNQRYSKILTSTISLAASLFYILNLGTLQMFYVQLEAFIIHFAALPWLYFSLIKLINNYSRKNFLIFIIINFLASGQGFIPPLFIAYVFTLVLFLTIFTIDKKASFSSVKKSLFILTLTFIINSYWLIPLTSYTFTRSKIYLNSYNNLLSTPDFIAKNKKYGDLPNVALIKGFIWEGFDHITEDKINYVYQPWIDHQNNILIRIIGFVFFGLSVLGLIYALVVYKNWIIKSFAFIYLFFFTGLTTNFFPFSIITSIFQELPIYKQAFRAAFTKFSLGLSFSYSIFVGFGILAIIIFSLKIYSYLNNVEVQHKKHHFISFFSLFYLLLIIYSLPLFSGNLFYKRLILDVPGPYFEIIDFFKTKENGRITEFPIDCPEGWYNYNWGYTGSGFYWYGISQPFLSRTFDVWSNYNENYYWEALQLTRGENFENLYKLFKKYDVKWILYDPNIRHCRHPKGFLHLDSLLNYLESSVNYKLVKQFTSSSILPIKIFEISETENKNFISLKNDLLNIGPKYLWNDVDVAYFENNDYVTDGSNNFDIYYPYRSLFTKRRNNEIESKIESDEKNIRFISKIAPDLDSSLLNLGRYVDYEKIILIQLELRQNIQGEIEIYLQYLLPEISLDGKELIKSPEAIKIGQLNQNDFQNSIIFINGQDYDNSNQIITSALSTTTNNTILILNQDRTELLKWESSADETFWRIINVENSLAVPAYSSGDLIVSFSKFYDQNYYGYEYQNDLINLRPKQCNQFFNTDKNKYQVAYEAKSEYLRLISIENRQCLIFNLSELLTSLSYLIEIETRNISGNYLSFYISNNRKVHFIDNYIYSSNKFEKYFYILPPSFPSEKGYDIYLHNYSLANYDSINDIKGFKIVYFPNNFLKNLKIINNPPRPIRTENPLEIVSVNHPLETHYVININKPRDESNIKYLKLSQSYDRGWKAYQINIKDQKSNIKNTLIQIFPFLFGEELKEHVLINNWANGWRLNNLTMKPFDDAQGKQFNNETIVIVYIPQYLEYLGFLLYLLLPIIYFSIKNTTH